MKRLTANWEWRREASALERHALLLRGFDGDRVLVLQDGNRIGGLGFESGDHAEPVNVLTVEKVEIVKGPATLLYGSNAIGGVVNTISGHDSAHKGLNGYLTGSRQH